MVAVYIPGLFVAGAIIGPQRGDKGGPTMAATIGPGGPAMADSHAIYGTRDCHSWSPRTDCGWDQLARDSTFLTRQKHG